MKARLIVGVATISATFIVLTGCAMTPRQDSNVRNHNSSFMEAWHAYSHCLSSKEPDAIVSDLHALNRFADTASSKNKTRTFGVLPYPLPPLPSRFAVDPAAMVSACADHGAEVALSLEHPRGSAELLITSVEAQSNFQ